MFYVTLIVAMLLAATLALRAMDQRSSFRLLAMQRAEAEVELEVLEEPSLAVQMLLLDDKFTGIHELVKANRHRMESCGISSEMVDQMTLMLYGALLN